MTLRIEREHDLQPSELLVIMTSANAVQHTLKKLPNRLTLSTMDCDMPKTAGDNDNKCDKTLE